MSRGLRSVLLLLALAVVVMMGSAVSAVSTIPYYSIMTEADAGYPILVRTRLSGAQEPIIQFRNGTGPIQSAAMTMVMPEGVYEGHIPGEHVLPGLAYRVSARGASGFRVTTPWVFVDVSGEGRRGYHLGDCDLRLPTREAADLL